MQLVAVKASIFLWIQIGLLGNRLDVSLEQETVWLSQAQMCELFGRERSIITKHINNIFKEEGLESSIATIEQGFGDECFYPNVASRAAD